MNLLGAVMLLLAVGQQPRPKPVALVLEAGSGSTLQRGAAARKGLKVAAGPHPLRDLDLLYPGDAVTAGADGALVVFLKGGRRERVQAGKKAGVEPGGCRPADAVRALTDPLPAAAVDALPELRGGERAGVAVLRDATGPAVSPLRESIVPSPRPALAWPANDKAARYEVRLTSGEGTDRKLEWSATAKAPRLPYPDGKPALARGKTYGWEASAVDADGRLVTAAGTPVAPVRSRFTVATEDEAQVAAALRPLAAGDDPANWLLAATLYDTYGFLNEALPLFEKVAEKRPEQGNVQALLAGYYGLAGQLEKAAKAKQKAERFGVKVETR